MEILYLSLCLISGLIFVWMIRRMLNHLFRDLDPVSLGAVMLIIAPAWILLGYLLSYATGLDYFHYLGFFLAGATFHLPLALLIGLYLLWWNPSKYKEYGMKMRRRQQQRDR